MMRAKPWWTGSSPRAGDAQALNSAPTPVSRLAFKPVVQQQLVDVASSFVASTDHLRLPSLRTRLDRGFAESWPVVHNDGVSAARCSPKRHRSSTKLGTFLAGRPQPRRLTCQTVSSRFPSPDRPARERARARRARLRLGIVDRKIHR